MTSSHIAKTPSGTEIVCARGATRYDCTATLVANGKTITGRLSGPVGLREWRDGASHWIAVGNARVGLTGSEANALSTWLDERPERTQAEIDYDTVRRADAEVEAAEAATYHDAARIVTARKAARQALADWRTAHPEAAEILDRQKRQDQAANLRRIADDAEHFSADGSYSPEERAVRADWMRAEAAELAGDPL